MFLASTDDEPSETAVPYEVINVKDGSETPKKKNKKHKKHKSKKKRKKRKGEKDSSSESGVESDGDSRTRTRLDLVWLLGNIVCVCVFFFCSIYALVLLN